MTYIATDKGNTDAALDSNRLQQLNQLPLFGSVDVTGPRIDLIKSE